MRDGVRWPENSEKYVRGGSKSGDRRHKQCCGELEKRECRLEEKKKKQYKIRCRICVYLSFL